MDCEKCEELMLDELYGELDDVTSALVRRHVAGCSRCNALLADLRGTREAVSAALVQEEAPPSLEERIFAAEKEARKVVPIRSRTSTFISIAGRWAMRPQTAMAALFLLMIGSTTFLLKGRPQSVRSSAGITVAQEGAPVAAPNAASPDTLGPNAARNAHGPLEPSYATPPPAAAPAATAMASSATGTVVALADDAVPKDLAKGDGFDPNAPVMGKAMARSAPRPTTAGLDRDEEDKKNIISNAGAPGGAPMPAAAPPPPPATYGAGPSGGAGGGGAGMAQQQAASESGYAGPKKENTDDFAQGMTAYRGRQFPQAMQSFDRASQGGDLNASLWAARAVRDGQGCGAALSRYDSVSQRGGGSYVGADATLEGAQCYAAVGSTDLARAKYTQLLNVPSHAARAQAGLDSLNQVAARKAPAARPKAAAVQAAPNAPPAQPPAQGAKPSPATDNNNSANQAPANGL